MFLQIHGKDVYLQKRTLTIKGTYGSRLVLSIPNNNVRKQYDLLLDQDKTDGRGVNEER